VAKEPVSSAAVSACRLGVYVVERCCARPSAAAARAGRFCALYNSSRALCHELGENALMCVCVCVCERQRERVCVREYMYVYINDFCARVLYVVYV